MIDTVHITALVLGNEYGLEINTLPEKTYYQKCLRLKEALHPRQKNLTKPNTFDKKAQIIPKNCIPFGQVKEQKNPNVPFEIKYASSYSGGANRLSRFRFLTNFSFLSLRGCFLILGLGRSWRYSWSWHMRSKRRSCHLGNAEFFRQQFSSGKNAA